MMETIEKKKKWQSAHLSRYVKRIALCQRAEVTGQ